MVRSSPGPLNPLESVAQGALLAAAFGVPLVFSELVFAKFALPKLVLLSAAVCVAAGARALAALRGGKETSCPMDAWVLFCLGAVAVAGWFSTDPVGSILGGYNSYVQGMTATVLFAGLYYLASRSKDDASIERLLIASTAAAALAGLCACVQGMGYGGSAFGGNRAYSTIGGPVFLGAFLGMAVPSGLWFALDREGTSRGYWTFAVSLIVGGLISSASRGGLLAAGAGAALVLYCKSRQTGRLLPLPSLRFGLGLCMGFLLLAGIFVARRATRLSDSARFEVWKVAVASFLENPLAGSGPDTFETEFRARKTLGFIRVRLPSEFQEHAHNDILQTAATMGMVGLVAYLGLTLAILRRLLARLGAGIQDFHLALYAALLSYFVVAKFNPVGIAPTALAAICLGGVARADAAGSPCRRPAVPIFNFVMLFFVAAVFARLAASDMFYRDALSFQQAGRAVESRAAFDTACRLNPCEPRLAVAAVNGLIDGAFPEGGGPPALEPLRQARRIAERLRTCRPHGPFSAYVGAVSELMLARAEGRDLGVAEGLLAAAMDDDPLFPPLIEARLKAALWRNDAALARHLEQRLGQINELEWKGK